jgi:hypothetical protein
VLTAPANSSLTTSYTPTLKWNTVTLPLGSPEFDYYQLQIATDKTFPPASIVEDVTTLTNRLDPKYTVTTPLVDNKTYYWRVRVADKLPEFGAWSLPFTLRTALLPPVLLSPEDAFASKELRPQFTWEAVGTATGYTLQIAKDSAFKVLVHTGNPITAKYTPTVDLPKGIPLYWRVQTKGANGPSLYSNYRTMTMPLSPSAAPILALPANASLSQTYTPTFKWNPPVMPAGTFKNYILQVDDHADFSSPEIERTTLTEPIFPSDTPLASNTKYYWRVRVVNTSDELSNWSPVWTLRTVLQRPELVSPEADFASLQLRPFFDWDVPSGAETITGYTIQFSKNDTFTQIVHTGNPVTSSYLPPVDLPKNTSLYWRVQARGANGPSAYSPARKLTMPVNPPLTPVLVLPAMNALITDTTPTFTWTISGTLPHHYILQVDNDLDFSSPWIEDDTSTTTSFTPSELQALTPNVKYYWRVRAVNAAGELGNWSVSRSFRTAILPPSLIAPADGTSTTLMPLLDWENVTDNTGYILQIWKAGTTPVLVKSVTLTTNTSQYQFISNLLPGTAYFWKVQTRAINGPSAWSESFDFVTAP